MRTRVRKHKGHSYIMFDIERPGSLTSTLSEADFPNLNQHDIETIIRWLKVASNLGVPTRLFLKRIRQYIFEMLHDFSVDYELADECNYQYTLKSKTYKKKLKDLPPGVVSGSGLLYTVDNEIRLFRFNDIHMYPTVFLETMIQFMTTCFQESQNKAYEAMIKELKWYLAFRAWLLRMRGYINFNWPYTDV
ncbi:hypothetical protein LXL04_028691 [Taraxacum kok-saghyz]